MRFSHDGTGRGRRLAAYVLITVIPLAGCAHSRTPAVVPPVAAIPRPPDILRSDLNRLLADEFAGPAVWGVFVQSIDTGDTLYDVNPGRLLMPGSSLKIVTLAASAERLGWDYRYETKLLADGTIEDGVLHGDLWVVGSGDPTINERDDAAARVFDEWASALKRAGISRVAGRIIGDDDAFDDERLGAGWAWDILPYGYSAPVGALQYNEDLVRLTFHTPETVGGAVAVDVTPAGSGLTVESKVQAEPPDVPLSLELRRLPGQTALGVAGRIPIGTPVFSRTASVENPTLFFVTSLREALIARGVTVDGPGVDIDEVAGTTAKPSAPSAHGPIAVAISRPLSEIANVMMTVSQNLYAETLLRTLGSRVREDGVGAVEAGRQAVRDVLTSWGLPIGELVQADGSGLSRYNYVTPRLLVGVLRRMRDGRHVTPFEMTLPVAGRDGTLAVRMKGTKAEGNARAKSGSVAYARALAGYVRTADGELLAFAVVANNFNEPVQDIDDLIDRIVERLAAFSRVPSPDRP